MELLGADKERISMQLVLGVESRDHLGVEACLLNSEPPPRRGGENQLLLDL